MKRLAAYLMQRWQYPTARIAFGSRVARCAIDGPLLVERGSVVANCKLESPIRVGHDSYVANSTIGSYSFIGAHSSVCRTSVGRFCSIGPHALMGTGIHPSEFISTSPIFYSTLKQCGVTFSDRERFLETGTIAIGHDVWIGARVFIRDGIRIASGAIVGAGAVVTHDVAPYAIVGGVPARLLRFRFPEAVISRLLELEWWTWDERKLRDAVSVVGQRDPDAFFRWATGGETPAEVVR